MFVCLHEGKMNIIPIFSILVILFIGSYGVNTNHVGISNRKFAGRLYQELSKGGGDVLVSPASLQAVLGLLQLGAEGITAAEIAQALSLPLEREELITNLTSIPAALHVSGSVEIALASAIYVRSDIKVAENFETAARNLGAGIRPLPTDFNDAVIDVNNWFSSATRGLLSNVLQSGDINVDTAMLLINALYFKGRWRDVAFNQKDNEFAKFYRIDGAVPMEIMRTVDYFNVGRNLQLNVSYLELPYVGDEFVLTIILPDDVNGLTRLINNIDHVINIPPTLHEEQVDLRLPRFRASNSIRLKPVLQRLGINYAFGNAQLSGLTADGKPLAVNDVIHNTLLEVNEKGTEAAAASSVGIVDRIFSQPIPFYADHPFLYLLQHKPTGIILFIGHFTGIQ